jgi:drug/metabolite transporter (DMT)-like permease
LTATWPVVTVYFVHDISPLLLMWMGTFLGFLYFIPWLKKTNSWSLLFDKKLRFNLFMIGTFGSAFPFMFLVLALKYTTPSNVAILTQIEVVYSIILATIFLREKVCFSQIGGTVLVLCGTIFILANERYTPRWQGDLIALATPWMYQVSHVFAKKLPKHFEPKMISSIRTFYAMLVLTPLVLVGFFTGGFTFKLGTPVILGILYWGFIVYGFSMVFWYNAMRNMDLAKAIAIVLSFPVMTFILSVLVGAEKPHWYQLIGLACAMGGAYWVTLIVKTQKRKEIKI